MAFLRLFLYVVFALSLTACSMNRLVVGQMTPVLENSAEALYEETDLELAEKALASNLKLLEGLLKSDPGNNELRLLLAQGYAGYALGFVEDEDPQRAKMFYLRARDYGAAALEVELGQRLPELEASLKQVDKDQLEPLFWTAFAWAGYINLSLDEPGALLQLPKVEAMMRRAAKLDDRFFHGAAYLFQGSVWGMKPRMMGGNPDKALESFEKNLEITDGRFLLSYVYMARYYAAKTLNEEAFDNYLDKVLQADPAQYPDIALFNAIAQKKARLLMEQKKKIF